VAQAARFPNALGKRLGDVTSWRERREQSLRDALRVPKILTTSFPEILATCR
jgi:hypothetical protein